MTVPNIGRKLARRIHHALDIDTLEELEMKAHAGLLQQVKGIGATKEEAIRLRRRHAESIHPTTNIRR